MVRSRLPTLSGRNGSASSCHPDQPGLLHCCSTRWATVACVNRSSHFLPAEPLLSSSSSPGSSSSLDHARSSSSPLRPRTSSSSITPRCLASRATTPYGPLTAWPFRKFVLPKRVSPERRALLASKLPGSLRVALCQLSGSRACWRTTAETKSRSKLKRAARLPSSGLLSLLFARSATNAAIATNVSSRGRHMRAVKPGNRTSAMRSAGPRVPKGSMLPGGSSAGSTGVARGKYLAESDIQLAS